MRIRLTNGTGFLMADGSCERAAISLVMETACREKEIHAGEGGEGSFFALSPSGCPLCFSSIPWKRLMVFFWEASGGSPLRHWPLSGSRPFRPARPFLLVPCPRRFFVFVRSRASLSPHQNSTRNDCIVDVDTNNVSRPGR